jgi:hypothetical protein
VQKQQRLTARLDDEKVSPLLLASNTDKKRKKDFDSRRSFDKLTANLTRGLRGRVKKRLIGARIFCPPKGEHGKPGEGQRASAFDVIGLVQLKRFFGWQHPLLIEN